MSIDVPHLLLALLAGTAIGIFYFAGLWWTVQRLPSARRPALLATVSFLARTLVSIFGFYMVMDGHWQRLLASVLGFVIARSFLLRRQRPTHTTLEARKGV